MNRNVALSAAHEQTLQALCTLSDLSAATDVGRLMAMVEEAPDPETAVQAVLDKITVASEVLERKWRAAIVAVWSVHHPHVPLLPHLSLASIDVGKTPVLRDAQALLAALEQESVPMIEEQGELLLAPAAVWRLHALLPSVKDAPAFPVESEWAYPNLRRLRAILQALRLVRPMKGNLVIVRSRLERFRAFPATQQFYSLWHADAYHVDWGEFAGMWGKFTRVMQDYLPLLWDIAEDARAGTSEDRRAWCLDLIETYAPLWEEEGLLEIGAGHAAVLPIVQQHALPTILEKFVLRDLLVRHGLASVSDEFGKLSRFTWTKAGESLLAAERAGELPCGLELLTPTFRTATPDHNDRFI